jgi:hypothetical protein
MNILICDELLNGTITNQFEISLESDSLTVRDLITKRVSIEIENYNKRLPEYFNGLIDDVRIYRGVLDSDDSARHKSCYGRGVASWVAHLKRAVTGLNLI